MESSARRPAHHQVGQFSIGEVGQFSAGVDTVRSAALRGVLSAPETKANCALILDAWMRWLVLFSRFTLRYRTVCERGLLVEQLNMTKRLDPATEPDKDVRLALLAPDMAYNTLGLQGCVRALGLLRSEGADDSDPRVAFCKELIKRLDIPAPKAKNDQAQGGEPDPFAALATRRYERGTAFGDVEDSLLNAARYIAWLRRSFDAFPSEPKQ